MGAYVAESSCCKKVGPIQGNVKVGGAIVNLIDGPRRTLAIVENATDGLVETLAQHFGLGIVTHFGQAFVSNSHGQVFACI